MPFQIILVVEANPNSRSDFVYINSILKEVYDIRSRNDVKISPVFMGGKGMYKNKGVVSEINNKVKEYSYLGNSHVVYCFDTDKYDVNPSDKSALREEEQYCVKNGYLFVWFCHDIEEVFWGKSVKKKEKTDKSKQYSVSNAVKSLNLNKFRAASIAKGRSNLLLILDKCFNISHQKMV